MGIYELTLYNDYWMDKEDYEDKLSDDMCEQPEYIDISNQDYNQIIKKNITETEFVKAIVINVG